MQNDTAHLWNLILALPLWTRSFTSGRPSLHICKRCAFDDMTATIFSRSQHLRLYREHWETWEVWPSVLTREAGKCSPYG